MKANGENLQNLVGKRVCFVGLGTWVEYVILTKESVYFVIDEDVTLCSAASGIVNPLTVIGFY